jgi:hypothetical protein
MDARNVKIREPGTARAARTSRAARAAGLALVLLLLLLLLVLLLLLLALAPALGCSPENPANPARVAAEGPPARRAFYYWRTVLQLSAAERQALAELRIERVYLRMFDVVWQDERAQRVGAVRLAEGQALPANVELVPVVFVREEVLRRLPDEARRAMTAELWREVQARAAAMGFAPRQLQLDCDWTDGTRAPFFAMLRELKELSGLPLSATIRLHQVKYRERTGVPPVERGMLMFYNMGKLSAEPGARAIFDSASASRYVSRVREYPLPLDVALPIWSWTVQVRGGGVVDVLQSTDPSELEGQSFLQRADERGVRYRAKATAFFRGALLREGDELVGEVTGPQEVAAAAALLAPALAPLPSAGTPRTLALFDLSERNLSRHGSSTLERLFHSLR